MTKPTRGRASKVDLLPESIKKQLTELLRDKSNEQQEILSQINQLIEDTGLPAENQLSRSGLNRYANRMEEIGARIRQGREMSEMWMAKLGDKPVSETGKILREILRTLGFEIGMNLMEGKPEDVCPKELNQLALMVQRLEEAETKSLKREQELKKAWAEEAAAEVENVRKQAGLSEEGAQLIKNQILGIG